MNPPVVNISLETAVTVVEVNLQSTAPTIEVSNTNPIVDVNIISTPEVYVEAGKQGPQGPPGIQGPQGIQGVSISDVEIAGGNLQVTLDNDIIIDAGRLFSSTDLSVVTNASGVNSLSYNNGVFTFVPTDAVTSLGYTPYNATNPAGYITGTVADNVFTLQDNLEPTKQAKFQLGSITTATTRTYTLPNLDTILAGLAVSQTFSNSNTFSNGTNTFGSATVNSTIGLASGATASGNAKVVNIGTSGVLGSTTNINIGSANGSTTTMLGSTVIGGVAGSQSLQVNNVPNSVNYLQVTGATANNGPVLSAVGSNADINIVLTTKGTGKIDVSGAIITGLGTPAAATDATTKQYVDGIAATLEPKLDVPAANGYILSSDTSGNRSWVNPSAPTEGTDIDQITTITKSLTLTTDWQDTGIKSTNLATGTYIIQLIANDIGAGGTNNNEYYSGTMSWYSGDTDSALELPTDEIVLHRAGGSGDGALYLRTYRTPIIDINNLKLQIYSNTANASAANYVFKFRRII